MTNNSTSFIILSNCSRLPTSGTSNRQSPLLTNKLHIIEMGRGLQQIPPGNTQVKTLNLAYNHLERLPGYLFYENSYKALQRIEMSHNRITNVSEYAFHELKQLKFVDLSYNRLKTVVDRTFTANTRLERLDLSGNRIAFIRNEPILLSHSLHILILSSNKIEHIFEFSFIGLPNLKHLILDNNQKLTKIGPRSFTTVRDIQYLSLAYTEVQNITESMFAVNKLPRILDLTDTPLGNSFNPPLGKIRDSAVKKIIDFNNYLVMS